MRPPRFIEPKSRNSSTAPPPAAAAGATQAAGMIGGGAGATGGVAAGVTGAAGTIGEAAFGNGVMDAKSRGSTPRSGVIDGGSADGGFRTIGGVTLGRGRGRGVTTTVRGGTIVVGGRVEGGVVLTGGVRVGGVVLTGSGTRVLGGFVEGVIEGFLFLIASKIAFSGILTPTDVDEDEPLFGVLSGWVLLGGVVVAPVGERLGTSVGVVVPIGGALVRGVTCSVLGGAVEVICRVVWAFAVSLKAAQAKISASVLITTGFTGPRIRLLPPRKA